MRILHTSDWHLGRSFHGYSTVPQMREVLGAIPVIVRKHEVDAVIVAGDIFDHAAPAADLYEVLAWAIRIIRDAGAAVVLTSGNHDNAIRLGFQSEWAALGGVHVITKPDAFRTPLELTDDHGTVDVYAIPYLEPMLQRGLYPGEKHTEHATLMARVTEEITELRARRGNRSIVISHCFAQNASAGHAVEAEHDGDDAEVTEDHGAGLQWDLTAGGVDIVPASLFEGHDYVALGHLHGRITLAPNIRYSGAPVHFSFSESAKPRGVWVADLDAGGLAGVQWIDLPVPRPLARLRGTLDELLEAPEHRAHEGSWVEATLTDRVRPLDPMRRLRARFPYCARIQLAPEGVPQQQHATYRSRVHGKNDTDLIEEFLRHVRAGEGADEEEQRLLREVIASVGSGDVTGRPGT